MARPCKADAELTRDKVLDAAELMFLEHGYGKTSLEMIARTAGVTRGAIYWHFADKVSLFKAMLQRVKLAMVHMFEQNSEHEKDPLQALYELCRASVLQLFEDERHYRVHAILLTRCEHVGDLADFHRHDLELHERLKTRCELLFIKARELGLVAADLDETRAAFALKAYVLGLFQIIVNEPSSDVNAQMIQALLQDYFKLLRKV